MLESPKTDAQDKREAFADVAAELRQMLDAFALSEIDASQLQQARRHVGELTNLFQERSRDWSSISSFDHSDTFARMFNAASGPANPFAPPLRCRQVDDGEFEGDCTLGPMHEGPKGYAHGGVSALLLDQLVGYAATVVAGTLSRDEKVTPSQVYTVHLAIDYRAPVPLRSPLALSARVRSSLGRKTSLEAAIFMAGDTRGFPLVTATALLLQQTTEANLRMDE